MSQPDLRVYETQRQKDGKDARLAKGKPEHWGDKEGSYFVNPWPSWRYHNVKDVFNGITTSIRENRSAPRDIASLLPVRKPTWGPESKHKELETSDKIKTTWLGHACFLVELPKRSRHARGARILFDPVFSERCSPVQFMGPKRFTPAPCPIEDIPEVDAVVISHNHYDHLNTNTITTLFKRTRKPHVFAPLGNLSYFESLKVVPKDHTHILDWWDSKRVEIDITSSPDKQTKSEKIAFDTTCTPGQHFTGRGIRDRFKTLWAGWVVQDVLANGEGGIKVYHAGDTGYRSVMDHQKEEEVPVCPAFKEIGEKFGEIDMAMIPIGAYLPREFMSPIHCAPQDSVRLFKDVRAKRAVGMHWGTWILTTEDVLEPPKRLAEECKKIGIEEEDFVVCDIGETLFF